jgi:hypothetical protein
MKHPPECVSGSCGPFRSRPVSRRPISPVARSCAIGACARLLRYSFLDDDNFFLRWMPMSKAIKTTALRLTKTIATTFNVSQ